MGQSASAILAYGIDLGESYEIEDWPEWLRGTDTDEDVIEKRVEHHGLMLITYGWEYSSRVLGIRCAWAVDYGCEEVPHAFLPSETRLKVIDGFKALSAPPEVLKNIKLLLMADYS